MKGVQRSINSSTFPARNLNRTGSNNNTRSKASVHFTRQIQNCNVTQYKDAQAYINARNKVVANVLAGPIVSNSEVCMLGRPGNQ